MTKQTMIALVLAVMAAGATYYYLNEKEAAIQADRTPVKVLVAKKPVSRGMQLQRDRVFIDEIPGAYVMPGAIAAATREGVAKQWETYQGQFALVAVAKGEQILANKFSRTDPGFAGIIPQGMRIIALALDSAAVVGGHVRPGNHVDIIGTFEHQYKQSKRTTSAVLAQDILVTAVGNRTAQTREDKLVKQAGLDRQQLTVCFAVAPDDSVRLALAEQEGKLKCILRAPGDGNRLSLPDQNLGTVLGPLMKVRKEEIQPAKKQIQIIRGMQ